MLKLGEMTIRRLLAQPETGMGYQTIQAVWQREDLSGTVFNGTMLLATRERQILERGYTELRADRPLELDEVRVLSRPTEGRRWLQEARPSEGPADQAPPEPTASGAVFKRFSAFFKDIRITSDLRLVPGSYATTKADAQLVRTGTQAVERYALPNPDPAIYVFTIEPVSGTPIQKGIVQPAFGHTGGGVEVLFPAGTTTKTVTGRDTIPP